MKNEQIMLPSKCAPQELSNEWSYQYNLLTIFNRLGNFCVLPLVTDKSPSVLLKELGTVAKVCEAKRK
jgi:hypothetical protein